MAILETNGQFIEDTAVEPSVSCLGLSPWSSCA